MAITQLESCQGQGVNELYNVLQKSPTWLQLFSRLTCFVSLSRFKEKALTRFLGHVVLRHLAASVPWQQLLKPGV